MMFNQSLSSFSSFDGEHIGHMFLFYIYDVVVLEFWNIKSSAGEIDKLSQQLVVGNRLSELLSKQIKSSQLIASTSYQSDILRINDFCFYLLTAARNWTFLSSTKTLLKLILAGQMINNACTNPHDLDVVKKCNEKRSRRHF